MNTVLRLCFVGCLLVGMAHLSDAGAQSQESDSKRLRPPGVERVRARIEAIRQAFSPQHAPPAPASIGAAMVSERPPGEGATRADLNRIERRLRRYIRELLAQDVAGGRGVETVYLPRLLSPIRPDTTALAPQDTVLIQRDTVQLNRDSIRVVRDTVLQSRVETIERSLLDDGVFRTFEVNFAFGSSTLQPRATRTLDAVGELLARYPNLRLEIAGHTDFVGSEAVNQRLSADRARAVRFYLTERFGVAPNRLVARGYGESRPVASNDTSSGRALNRRVEFTVLNPGVMSGPRP